MPRKKAAKQPQTTALVSRFEMRMTEKEKAMFQEAARKQAISLAQWIRLSCWQTVNEHGGQVKLLQLEQ